ncbi:Disease resistance protein [Arachis hypogaea]|nr:Disease resistance protein [Arachis hypogaea]
MKNLCLNDASFKELVPLERLAKIESLGVVPQLKSLKLTDLPDLEMIGFERDPILQRIETLVFQNCPSLKTIAPSNVFFSHLTKLEVVDCKTLKYLMSPSTARSLGQLNTMKVNNCESLAEIVSEEGQEDNKNNDDIIFKQLTTIELASLKRLESFCRSKSCAFQFPSLEKFVVSACPELKSFSQEEHMKPPPKLGKVYVVHEKDKVEAYWTNNLQETIRDIFNKKIFFKGMEELSVSDDLAHLQQLWQCKGELFNNLKTLKLSDCELEPYAIPSNVIFSFKNLRELEVDSCKKITGIFEMNDTEIKETSFQLKKLTLKWLPNVKHVWNPEKQGILSFKSLQIVTVNGCEELRTLFPIALARDLKKLEELDVRGCDELSNIIEGGTVDEDLVFPCLTTLALCYLPNLTGFCSQKFTLPELNCLVVYDCNDQLELFQSQGEENQNSTSTAKQPLFMNITDISKMENLTLNWRHTQALSSWSTKLNNENLESLNELALVDDDEKRNSNVPVELFEKTPNLETLEVCYYCDENLKNILPSHHNANNKEVLGNLKELKLYKLDELKSMSGVEYLSKQLRLLDVSDCPKLMTTIVLQSSSNLKELHIESCDAMLRLFTSLTAKMLIHLEELQVESCESLKEIVGEEQQSATEDEVIEFEQLQRITLRSLESLECFYSGNATLKLPSLIQLDIVNCSKMKVFSHGNVDVSRSIQVSYNDSSDDLVFHRDLNNAVVLQSLSQRHLDLGDHLELKDLWLSKVHISAESYSSGFNLECLMVKGCDEFFTTAILPSHLLPFLNRLQELVVRGCNSVETIFEVKDTPSDIVIPLKTLALKKLPNLRHVWNKDSEEKLSLPDLEVIIVDECASIKSVFSESVGKGNIQRLKVENCAELVEIVAGDDVAKQISIFSTLSCLKMVNLPNLKCPLLSQLLPFLHKLEELMVEKCGSLKTIFDVKDAPTNEQDTNMIIVIPLKKLTLEKLPTLSHVWKGKLSLPKLEEVIIDECASLKSLCPESVNIQRLEVKNCEKVVEIVTRNELAKEDADKQVNIFSKLSCLKLWNLPNLSYIYHEMEDSEFSLSNALLPWHMLPSLHRLEELVVGNCDSFETIFDVKDAPTNNVKDTAIDIPLKKLTLEHLPTLSHIWNNDPKGSSLSFLCLEEVVVNGCKSLTSLLPASLPMSNMKKIDVKNCEELVEIVTKDEADNEETNKELIMFPELTSLTLHNLPNLTYIYAGMQILNLRS